MTGSFSPVRNRGYAFCGAGHLVPAQAGHPPPVGFGQTDRTGAELGPAGPQELTQLLTVGAAVHTGQSELSATRLGRKVLSLDKSSLG